MGDVSKEITAIAASETAESKPAIAGLSPFIDGVLKFGSLLYILGFLVIMVHTFRLGVPVVEALHFQNVLAGWPVGLAALSAYLLWPSLKQAIDSAHPDGKSFAILVISLLLSVFVLWVELHWFGLQRYANGAVLFSGCILFANACFLVLAYNQSVHSAKPFLRAAVIYSLLFFLTCLYAVLLYPKLSQSFGGGRPEQVRLYFKSPERSLLDGSGPSDDHSIASDHVYLYYRTSDFLLVSKDANSDQLLTQIPGDQIHAVVWLQSHSKPD